MKKLILILIAMTTGVFAFSQGFSDLFISEYVEGSGNNKAIELYNPTNGPINLGNYQLVRYSNGGFIPYAVALAGTLQAKDTYVVVIDKRDPNGVDLEQPVDLALQAKADTFLCPIYEINRMMYFNGNDAVTLEKLTGEIVDVMGLIGPPMTSDDNGWGNLNDTTITYNSGGVPTEYTINNYIVGPLFWLAWTKDHTLLRKQSITDGVKNNPDPYFIVDIAWDSLPENTFDSLGSHNCLCNTLSVDENKFNSKISLYPNPTVNHEFTVQSEEAIREIKIIDISGRLVDSRSYETKVNDVNFKFSENLQGFYFVKIQLDSGLYETRKILFN